MKKYYYYCYQCNKGTGNCVSFNDGEFDVYGAIKYLHTEVGVPDAVILNWKEISSKQFKKLSDYYDELQK